MKKALIIALFLALFCTCAIVYASNTPITQAATIHGKYFQDQRGNRLDLRGVDFQPVNGVDPLLDVNGAVNPVIQALLNPANTYSFSNLNNNAIRVYQVDPTHTHAKTMAALANAGIYVYVGMANDDVNIPSDPGVGESPYPVAFQSRMYGIIDEFSKYPNVFAFEVGNEVTGPASRADDQLNAVAAIKQAAMDAKNYMISKHDRAVPVGVALRDVPSTEAAVAQYYTSTACNGKPLDYIGINTYRYAPPNGDITAYDALVRDYGIGSFPSPVLLTEYEAGVVSGNRDFLDVPTFYNDQAVLGNISGGFAYQFIENGSGKGSGFELVKLGAESNGLHTANDVQNLQPTTNQGFINLQTQYQAMVAQGTLASPLSPGVVACPTNFNPQPIAAGSFPSGPAQKTIGITVQDTLEGTQPLAVVQNGAQLLSPITDANAHSVNVDSNQVLLLQQTGTWYTVCQVAAGALHANAVVKVPAAAWGGPCAVT